MNSDELLAARRRAIGGSARVGYRRPVHIVRGAMQYLFDETGRRYLDGYNNVPHVGHCHPRVVDAAARQMRALTIEDADLVAAALASALDAQQT